MASVISISFPTFIFHFCSTELFFDWFVFWASKKNIGGSTPSTTSDPGILVEFPPFVAGDSTACELHWVEPIYMWMRSVSVNSIGKYSEIQITNERRISGSQCMACRRKKRWSGNCIDKPLSRQCHCRFLFSILTWCISRRQERLAVENWTFVLPTPARKRIHRKFIQHRFTVKFHGLRKSAWHSTLCYCVIYGGIKTVSAV